MKLVFAILVFAFNVIVRDGSVVGSLLLAIGLTILVSSVFGAMSRAARQGHEASEARSSTKHRSPKSAKSSEKKPAPAIKDGDIGPFVASMLERGNQDAVIRCIEEYVPDSWPMRQELIALVEEHGMLRRSFRIATLAGVAMPEEASSFSTQQSNLIADRARRMAFIHLHGTMNPRIEASLTRLVAGAEPLIAQSGTLRADLAESTANPQWGAQEEKELLRKLARMSNTLQAMNSDLAGDDFGALVQPEGIAALEAGPIPAADVGSILLTPREREVLALLAEGMSNPAIAGALYISERTVTTHLSRLYAKLDVSTRTEAIALAMRTGLVPTSGERA